jgi:hypothetical protein
VVELRQETRGFPRGGIGILTLLLALLLAGAVAASAEDFAAERRDWERFWEVKQVDSGFRVEFHVALYANRYVEAIVREEAAKNLWTKQEEEEYKYQLLKNLRLSEYLPVKLDILNYGPSMHMAPFDKQVALWIDNKKYTPVEYDTRFNFALQGKRDGLIFFPRYDAKTGKSLLEGAKTVKFSINGSVTQLSKSGGYIDFLFDISRDSPLDLAGVAAEIGKIDRLLKRSDKLKAQKADLQKQMDAVGQELKMVQDRIDQLQKGQP